MLAGHVLHYRILRPLGAGGMGEVYVAEDERLGRRVALKFLPHADASDVERRERLKREARALASLSHAGIASVYALEEDDHRLFLVMEYVEGETLAGRLARRPLPVPEVIERGIVLADALAHAHARGVIHRDIKPSNILITREDATKLADFGLALTEGETRITKEGASAGTADHMSPEQTRGGPLDARSDLFSVGVVLYESLTGVRPFARDTLEATFHAVRAEEPEPPTALRSGIPLELERIVMKLLRKNPDERYPSASDLGADLRALRSREVAAGTSSARVADGAGASAPTATVPGARRDPMPHGGARLRRRALGAGAAVVILLAAFLIARSHLLSGRPRAAEGAPRSIAVLTFQQMADPSDAHGEAAMATNLLTVGLGQSPVVPVLSNQRVHDVLQQMGKTERSVTGSDALEVGRRAGATYIVVGYIYRTDPEYVIGAEVSSTANGSVLTSCRVQAAGGEQGIFAAVDSLTQALQLGLSKAGVGIESAPVDVADLTSRNPAAYRAYVRGLDLLDRAEWERASATLHEAVDADSSFALAWYYLAIASWWAGDVGEARGVTDRAARLGGGLAARERAGLLPLRQLVDGEYARGARGYRDLLRRYPDDKEFLYGLGEGLYHDGRDLTGARNALNRAVELDPTFAVAYQHIFDIDVEEGSAAAVAADADRLQRGDPDNPLPAALEMRAFAQLGDGAASVAIARKILARDPVNQDGISMMALVYRMSGEFDSAAIYNHLLDRTSVATIYSRTADVWLLLAQGRNREAERRSAELMKGIDLDHARPTEMPIGFTRVRALMASGRLDEAWALAPKASSATLRGNPNTGMSLEWLGNVALATGHRSDAERILVQYDQILTRSPSVPERKNRNLLAALIAMDAGRAGEAVRLMQDGAYLGPPEVKSALTDWALARAYLGAGDRSRALPVLKRIVDRSIVAGDPEAVFPAMILLAREYEREGQPDEALALYRRVAHQYRFADPGVKENEEAKAAIARLEQARAQAAARR